MYLLLYKNLYILYKTVIKNKNKKSIKCIETLPKFPIGRLYYSLMSSIRIPKLFI